MARRKPAPSEIKKCPECGGPLRAKNVDYSFSVGRAAFSGDVPALICSKCGEELADGAAMARLELDAAVVLTGYKPSADAIRFFRSVLNLKGKDFADLVGVAAETVSRWENGVREIDAAAWGHLCSMVLDKSTGATTTIDRLRANAEVRDRSIPAKKLVLKPA